MFFKLDPILLPVGYHLFALGLSLPRHPFWEKFAMRFVPESSVARKYHRLEARSSPGFAKAHALQALSREG
ncbi:hypothetical protein, partial [Thermus scotoductus]|uniref:hypothetical protein n=1 Tax=Thermus scotoductus TaxID=37636 RepID=UPI001C12B7DC